MERFLPRRAMPEQLLFVRGSTALASSPGWHATATFRTPSSALALAVSTIEARRRSGGVAAVDYRNRIIPR
jgi:hypothetical protein